MENTQPLESSEARLKTRELSIEYVSVDSLKPFVDNPRDHSERNIADIKRSITKYGWTNPILVRRDDNMVIAGHGRLEAAKLENRETVPVIYLDFSANDAKGYAVADNRTGDTSEWNLPALEDLMGELAEIEDFEPLDVGFDGTELDELLASQPNIEVIEEGDFDARLLDEPISQTGDLWTLGNHRLICGDCTDKAVVERVMEGEKAALCLTDPPYGINAVSSSGVTKFGKTGGGSVTKFGKVGGGSWVQSNTYPVVTNDENTDAAKQSYLTAHSCGISDFIIYGGIYFTDFLPPSRCWVVWDKENTGTFADAELAWTSFDKNVALYRWLWNGLSRKGDRLSEGSKRVHPTQKPVGLIVQILQDFISDNQSVYDPFLGSGTTLIACEQLNRKCRAIEIEPLYIDVSVRRYVEYVGSSDNVTCERDGQTLTYSELFEDDE